MPIDPLAHRRLLAGPADFHPFRGGDVLARLGGQAAVDRLVEVFYDRVGVDPGFEPLFARDLTAERARQKEFLGEWLGGERRYSGRAYAGLGHRHEALEITPALAARWLGHFRAALESVVADAGARAEILAGIGPLAAALINASRCLAVRTSTACACRAAIRRSSPPAPRDAGGSPSCVARCAPSPRC